MRFVRDKICSSGVSSSTKSEVSCFRNTIPPKGWEAVVEMPEVPHQGIPCTTGVFSEKESKFKSPFNRGVSKASCHKRVCVDLPVPEGPENR